MQLSRDRIGALLLLVFCSAYWFFTYDIRMLPFQEAQAFNAQTMPEALAFLGVGLSIVLFIFPSTDEPVDLRGFNWGVGAAMIALMVVYGLTLRPLGFIVSTSLFLMIGYAILGERKPLTLILASVPVVVAFWALMTQGLDIFIDPLPVFLQSGS